MSAWRRKAIECLPEFREEFEDPKTSIYDVFIEFRSALMEAHQAKNVERTEKIYAFAEWCFTQKTKDLWNAAGVSFYEHLADSPEIVNELPQWIKPELYLEIRPLIEPRIEKDKFKLLDKRFGIINSK